MNKLVNIEDLKDAIMCLDWYHQNQRGEMVHGANDDEHQAWYKAEDIYKAIEYVPSAQLAQDLPKGCTDTISRAAVGDALNGIEISRNASWYEFYQKALTAVGELPSAQPGWIPCSKKLPELNRSVLVQLSDDFVDPIQIMTLDISKCEGDFFYFWRTQEMGINFDMDDVVAWQPLPTPYREGGQEQNHESTI